MTAMTTATTMRILQAEDRGQWRAWLCDNCVKDDEIWLVIQHANSATRSVGHRDAVEEALCFGWIDSLTRRRDADSRWQRFTPRNPRSAWSNINRELVERLTVQGLMTPHGQAAVDLAKRTGTWSMLAAAQNGVVPDDLRAAHRRRSGSAQLRRVLPVGQAGDLGMDRPGQATRDSAALHRTHRRMRRAKPAKANMNDLDDGQPCHKRNGDWSASRSAVLEFFTGDTASDALDLRC